MQINDGKGTGYTAEVNSANQLETRSVSQNRAEWENHNHAKAFAFFFSQAAGDAAATEYLGYIKNDSDDDMVVDEISVHATAADSIYVVQVTGTAAGGTAVVPKNMNLGSGLTASCTTMKHTNITGLTQSGTRLLNFNLAAAGFIVRTPYPSILMPKNTAIAVVTSTDQAQTLSVNIMFHYETKH